MDIIEKSASTPHPPYYAVIFTSLKLNNDEEYNKSSEHMLELVAQSEGFLGVESLRNDSGFEVTISYWRNLEDIKAWKNNFEHLLVQKRGRENWYKHYKVRICKVEREYDFNN
jgi:heme-degrading monooxygenase HmoA